MKAILLPYASGQNEPSRPVNKIVTLPTNVKARDEYLKKLFVEHVCELDDPEELTIRELRGDYGDLIVEHPTEMYLFVTFVSQGPLEE